MVQRPENGIAKGPKPCTSALLPSFQDPGVYGDAVVLG